MKLVTSGLLRNARLQLDTANIRVAHGAIELFAPGAPFLLVIEAPAILLRCFFPEEEYVSHLHDGCVMETAAANTFGAFGGAAANEEAASWRSCVRWPPTTFVAVH